MKFAHVFVDRPIFASVLSILITIVGLVAYAGLPVAQYPEIAPPTIVVRASYPGANAETVASTLATPLEQQINGVEDMLYMSSYSTSDGSMSLTITFKLGTDLDKAQVLVQNRVSIAIPRLPEEVRRLGITTLKSSPDLMMVVHMLSPEGAYDQLYVSNYAQNFVRDVLARLDGVGDITLFGAREYSMRVWLDPEKMAGYALSGGDIVKALQEQNVQVSGGSLGQEPAPSSNAFQLTLSTQGRFQDVRQFRNVIVKATDDGRLIRLQDIARVELGARDYVTNSYLSGKPAVALAIFQRPGTNALQAAENIIRAMDGLKRDFPKGIDYRIVYNPTEFIAESVREVYKTLYEAVALVVLVVIIFLQSWRTALIPIVAIPVSLIGTFAVMAALGFSLNTLTLFGLVLAIGIVVDDAVTFVGFSGATFTNASNAAAIFARFKSYEERRKAGLGATAVVGQLFGRLQAIQDAFIIAIPPPPVRGIGNAGGFKLQVEDRTGIGLRPLLAATYELMGRAQKNPQLTGVFTTFNANTPQIYLEIDRTKARMLNVPIPNIFEALSINLGSAYVNDFNAFGRVYQVRAQADQAYRVDREDIQRLKVRSATGALVPLGTLVELVDTSGPDLVQRYNLYPSVPLQGNGAPGVSSGQALEAMESLARESLPQGTVFDWTELAFQERSTGNTAMFIFGLSVLFVFLVLAAQYESWSLPLAIILIVPMSVLSALVGVTLRNMDNNILTQIGLVLLVGLAAKNAILIVEFARQIEEEQGKSPLEAVVEASRLRLRPILMTAFAFILGVVPLVVATGPGAEMRQALGTAVFSGMLGVTFFGLILTPVFYVAIRSVLIWAAGRKDPARPAEAEPPPVPMRAAAE